METQPPPVLAGPRKPLEEVTLGVKDLLRIDVLGPDDAGKSTPLRLIAGLQEPDGGQVTKCEGVTVLILNQADHLDPSLWVVDVAHPGPDEYEQASNPVIHGIHTGLLTDIRFDAEVGTLSGERRRRVALVRVLAVPSDIVCLGEPANHLDIEGVAWLAVHLNTRFTRTGAASTLLAITHDRWSLSTVCEHIWEVVLGVDPGEDRPQIPGHVGAYEGSYAAYTLVQAERAKQADVATHKCVNLLTRGLTWL